MIPRAWGWVFWSLYLVLTAVGVLAIGIATHFVAEDIFVLRSAGKVITVEERCDVANEFALPAIVLAIGACMFGAFLIRTYFAPRWFAAH